MSWNYTPNAVSEEALIDNTLTLVTANFKTEIDRLYPTEAALPASDPLHLPDFRERALGQVLGNEAPMLGIAPVRNASTLSDDSSYLTEALRMDLAVGVTDDGPQTVTRRIMRYMRALEAVLRRGNKNDFFGIVNSSRTFGFSLDCEHVYRQDIRTNTSIYFRDATLQVTVNIREGQ
jgi:hypothetical protein